MSNDYLWDRSGPVDAEVERLEQVLGKLRHGGDLRFPAPMHGRERARWIPAAIAAAVMIGAGVAQLRVAMPLAETPWQVVAVEGYARLGSGTAERAAKLRTGQHLRTDGGKVTLEADEIGRIDVAAGSELRVTESTRAKQTLALRRGLIHALIWAPPRRFVVDTPSARTIDLGCEYTLSVDDGGDGLVRVKTGWVAFQFDGRDSFIPAGAACRTTRRGGPGTPYFEEASEELRRALAAFDAGGNGGDLKQVLAEARPRDGLTLWHLLTRAAEADRGLVFDRFATFVALPAEVTREGVLAKDRRMLDLCWNALNLENAEWWREWKRAWQP
jgi:hypothetical protein